MELTITLFIVLLIVVIVIYSSVSFTYTDDNGNVAPVFGKNGIFSSSNTTNNKSITPSIPTPVAISLGNIQSKFYYDNCNLEPIKPILLAS